MDTREMYGLEKRWNCILNILEVVGAFAVIVMFFLLWTFGTPAQMSAERDLAAQQMEAK